MGARYWDFQHFVQRIPIKKLWDKILGTYRTSSKTLVQYWRRCHLKGVWKPYKLPKRCEEKLKVNESLLENWFEFKIYFIMFVTLFKNSWSVRTHFGLYLKCTYAIVYQTHGNEVNGWKFFYNYSMVIIPSQRPYAIKRLDKKIFDN